jgi:hypothetical protein
VNVCPYIHERAATVCASALCLTWLLGLRRSVLCVQDFWTGANGILDTCEYGALPYVQCSAYATAQSIIPSRLPNWRP